MASLRILVADDEADVLEYYQRLLPRLGHQVVAVAANGRDLVALSRELRPDLVITDLRMPGMDGHEAARELWQDSPIPVLFISADAEDARAACVGGHSPAAALAKPVKRPDLERALAAFFPEAEPNRVWSFQGAFAST